MPSRISGLPYKEAHSPQPVTEGPSDDSESRLLAPKVHPSAIVSDRASLAAGVVVGPYCIVEDDVEIGRGTVLGPHVILLPNTTLGARCRVHAGAVLGDLPQDQAYQGAQSGVRVGDRCVVREHVTIHRGTKPETVTEVGDDSLLMACSHVGHNARLGRHVTLANGALIAGYADIGDQAFISGNCMVHQFTRVGKLAMMTGGSATQMDVPPFCLTQTLAANTVMSLNVVGLRRAGVSAEERRILKSAFDALYRSGYGIADAIEAIEQLTPTDSVREMCWFLRGARRGICKLFRSAGGTAVDAPVARVA